jgi:hypothetical protein
MNRSPLILALAAGALLLQGCAGTGDVTYGQGVTPPPAENSASASYHAPTVNAGTKADFETVEAAVHKEMQKGGRWQYVDSTGRERIDAKFADMQSLFDKYDSVDKMDSLSKSRLLDDQNTINEVLARDDANRMICEEIAPTGSHISRTQCRTYGEMRAEQNNAKFDLKLMQRQSEVQTRKGG